MRRKNKKFYIVLILIVLFGVSVGYAAISRVLTITGNSEVKQNTWDIHFENIQIKKGSVTATKEPTLENSNTSVNFSFMLDLPGDYYEFTVDAVNKGTIDAMIESITKTPELTAEQAKYLNYIIEYQNGEQISSKQLVAKDSFVRIKVRVEFRSDVSEQDMPTTNQSLDLGFTLNYVQADSTATSVKDNGEYINPITVVSGDGTKKGDEVCIGEECFYVMYSDEDTVTMLAKYNLYVGNECISELSCTPYGDEATGKQDSTMIGHGITPKKGVMEFSIKSYWNDTVSSYPTYVYDSKSILYSYVENYKMYLSTLGVAPSEARLITEEELNSLGCNCSWNSCMDAPSWVYSSSYWAGTATSSSGIRSVSAEGVGSSLAYHTHFSFGCRPVIVIPKSDIVVPKIKPVANGSLDDIGTIVTIGSEQFYTIGTEGDNVKLLSMYNLYVGNECTDSNSSSCTSYGREATGMQDERMTGCYEYGSLSRGTTDFSTLSQKGMQYSDYSGSLVEVYVNNYKTLLENNFDLEIEEARLITYAELTDSETFACSEFSSCSSDYSWIMSTSYWVGSAYDSYNVWMMFQNSYFSPNIYNDNFTFGVRPVISMSKSLF